MAALDDTFGALLIGVLFAAVLYGFTCIQTWYYFAHYSSDRWYIKLVVIAAFVSDTCHQVLISHVVYTYLITWFGDFEKLGYVVWTISAEVIFNGFTTLLVQCFLTMRVFRLSNQSWLMAGPVLMLVLVEFILSMIFSVRALHITLWSQAASLKALSLGVNVSSAIGDTIIAACLCYLLHTSRTGVRRSDTLVKRLILFSINTGLLTSICALASLVSYTVWPKAFIYSAFYFSIGRLYCNCLLATLNARRALRGQVHTGNMALSLSNMDRNQTSLTGASSKNMPNNISIKIDTTRELVADEQHYLASGDAKDRTVV